MIAQRHEHERREGADKSYLDYIRENADGSWSGIRVKDKICYYISTRKAQKTFRAPQEIGSAVTLPLEGDAPKEIRREQAALADPELDKLLSGGIALKEIFGKWKSAGSGQ